MQRKIYVVEAFLKSPTYLKKQTKIEQQQKNAGSQTCRKQWKVGKYVRIITETICDWSACRMVGKIKQKMWT